VVETREMKVEVLGTSFEINTYGDRGEISATLVSGAVHVSAEGNSVIMSPNQQLIYDLNKGVMKLNKVDALRHVRWKDGVLVINNERFDDLVWKLERWYGVSIINRTGLKFNQLFSGEFDREDIQHAIKTICVNLNISYIIEKEEIYLIR
jgi:ferric-dicitrate binding protein FerR (iron transport regulator)